jgi:hypothetical protein
MLRRFVLTSAIVLCIATGVFADTDQPLDFSVGAAKSVTLVQGHQAGQCSHTITINNQHSATTVSGLLGRQSPGGISSVERGTIVFGDGIQGQHPLTAIQRAAMLVGLTQEPFKIGAADGVQGFRGLVGGQTLMVSFLAARTSIGGQSLRTAQHTRVVGGQLEEHVAYLGF